MPRTEIGTTAWLTGTSQWYLIALDGDMVLRVRPGMPLGETAAGELSFDPSCAQLELDIADDGDLMLSAVDDHELEFGGGTRCRARASHARSPPGNPSASQCPAARHRLRRSGAGERDGGNPCRATDRRHRGVAIRAVAGSGLARSRRSRCYGSARPHIELVGNGSVSPRAERAGARGWRIQRPSMAALIALSGLGLALLYWALRGLVRVRRRNPRQPSGLGRHRDARRKRLQRSPSTRPAPMQAVDRPRHHQSPSQCCRQSSSFRP